MSTIVTNEKFIKHQVEKWLEPYYEYSMTIEIGMGKYLPKLVPNYGHKDSDHKDIAVLKHISDILEQTNMDDNQKKENIEHIYGLLKKSHPEMVNHNSSTEQFGIMRMEISEEYNERLNEKKEYIKMINDILSCLSEDQKNIIKHSYLVARPHRKSQEQIAEILNIPARRVWKEKKEAISSIARLLNII